MKNKRTDGTEEYLIVVEGIIDNRWQDWFEHLIINPRPDGCTYLIGPIRDQAELHGILKRISNLGLKLISVNPHDPSGA